MTDERLAELFHETYERLAPQFGYETRSETRQFDPATPNGRLMIAVCGELRASLRASPCPNVDSTKLAEELERICALEDNDFVYRIADLVYRIADLVQSNLELILAALRAAPAQEPSEAMVEVVLQTFRREIDIHMDTHHPSSSPGHDSMRIALRAGFALPPSGQPGKGE